MPSNPLHKPGPAEHPASPLDELIEKSLRLPPNHPLPEGFHRRLHTRLCRAARVAAVMEEERRAFRARLWQCAGLTAGALMVLVGLGSQLDLFGWLAQVPGGMGLFDYASASAGRTSADLFAAAAAVTACAVALVGLTSRLRARAPRRTAHQGLG